MVTTQRVFPFCTPRGVDDAQQRLVLREREIARICVQLSDPERRRATPSRVEYENWAKRARRARERLREECAFLHEWISGRYLDLLKECAKTIETIDDLSTEEENLLFRLDEVIKNK